MDTEKRQKYFVSQNKVVTIKCQTCGRAGTYSVETLKHKKHSVKINCSCTKTFEVDLEFRHDFRNKSHISGKFRALSTPRIQARQCIIANQSSGGLLLQVTEDVLIKKDDQLIVSYRPSSSSSREIERIISVRHYDQGHHIGGAFIDESPSRTTRPVYTALH